MEQFLEDVLSLVNPLKGLEELTFRNVRGFRSLSEHITNKLVSLCKHLEQMFFQIMEEHAN